MNQEQRRYAMNRVSEIRRALEEQLREKHTNTKKKEPSAREKLRAVRNGEAYLKSNATLNTTVGDAFGFDELHRNVDAVDESALKKAKAKLRKEVAKITDEITFGDSDKAVKLLQKFEESVS